MRNIAINRLKDKLGTRKVPTAELTLHGTPAILVGGRDHGVRAITPMLTVTRTWNSVIAASIMQRALVLAKDFARRRRAFGASLAEKPLHIDTLAGIQAETEGATLLALRVAELLGRIESGEGTDRDRLVARILTPIAKLTTGKQAVAVTSEALEAFGGAGYVEDTGLPRLLADAQVLPIWEGTTNVLSLDTLRGLGTGGALQALRDEIRDQVASIEAPELRPVLDVIARGGARASSWLENHAGDRALLESGARRFSMTLGRTAELALLAAHADWCLRYHAPGGRRAVAAARRMARHGVDCIGEFDGAHTEGMTAGDAAALFGE